MDPIMVGVSHDVPSIQQANDILIIKVLFKRLDVCVKRIICDLTVEDNDKIILAEIFSLAVETILY